ncbi:RluA family pseudouridine synthase [Desulfotalea psychrophila]|uniref:Probable ribosomal large subunit pseudouridine synthase A n=1 Tax=Desulfotalea psychrophila (strain LSv54 / DSM 12343) TaxID=177439 RepID=Q6AIJ2_DESPS|nr:RluA family pseudouridine synthase [Desulfotalea psychrophila]CAG37838.1 probable ribosomal large subunit pseudouridine synthase A [Desulfotalea psychrophila LSv54]
MKELKIIYRDDHLVVVIKPGGLLSVPGRGPENSDCVSSRLQAKIPEMITQPAVHRLDMYTSGLMVYAVSKEIHRALSIQFQEQQVDKKYTALLEGCLQEVSGEIRLPFRVDLDNRPIQILDYQHGKMGITLWRKMDEKNGITRVEFTPMTGRTHQLRVHAAHAKGLGIPIIGDSFYGSGRDGDEMMLHAHQLSFTHPIIGEKLYFKNDPDF